MSGLIAAILDTVTQYQNSKLKSYQNIRHVMTCDGEILVPNKTEEYVFRLQEGWEIIGQDNDYLIIRRTNDGKEKI